MLETKVVLASQTIEKQELARMMRREMTASENILWQSVRNNKLKGLHFRRQQVISGFIADFYCHQARLIVEVDGSVHDEQVEYDLERSNILTGQDMHVLRFDNDSITNDLESVLSTIEEVAFERIAKRL